MYPILREWWKGVQVENDGENAGNKNSDNGIALCNDEDANGKEG